MDFKKLALVAAIGTVLSGCGADDQSYDKVERHEREIAVKDLREGRWFYVPTSGAAPRFAISQFPFLLGEANLVEVCFTQRGLEVRGFDKNYPEATLNKDQNNYCKESDIVQDDDSVNLPHVLTIPGTFTKYRCREDSYGDCTNKEEVNSDKDVVYTAKTHFTPNPVKVEVGDVNFQDVFGVKDGLSEIGSPELISYEFDPKSGVLNFELERTFKINDLDSISKYVKWDSRGYDTPEEGSFKTRFYYSLVHESHLVSEDYKPVLYPVGDENDIGFFTTGAKKLNPLTNLYDKDVVYLNRFNPDAPIQYYLSDNFFEEKNKLFLDATLATVDKMNKTLRLFGSDSKMPYVELVNRDKPANVHTGDLRYNVINLIDEPLDNGLLGYGPSVTNPLTGEIIKAHVNQYSGVARRGSRMKWDNMVRLYNLNQLDLDGLASADANSDSSTPTQISARINNLATMSVVSRLSSSNDDILQHAEKSEITANLEQPSLPKSALLRGTHDDMDFADIVAAEENRLAVWSENNIYPEEASWVSSTTKAQFDSLALDDERYFIVETDEMGAEVSRKLKRWSQLPEDLKATVADLITVNTYSNTLVHEIGHNLGLRHNFKASTDKRNFYSIEQARALGLSNIPAYSSTMDYSPSNLDELPTWGLYDIAAFRFGYGRILETVQPSSIAAPAVVKKPDADATEAEKSAYNVYVAQKARYEASFAHRFGEGDHNQSLMQCSEVVKLKGIDTGRSIYNCSFEQFDDAALNDKSVYDLTRYGVIYYLNEFENITRKSYAYCTDGHTSLNSDCNRFDEGLNLEQITNYEWQKYLNSWDIYNTSEYATNGRSAYSYIGVILARYREMNSIRDKVEDFERIDALHKDYGLGKATDKPTDTLMSITRNCELGVEGQGWTCDYRNAGVTAASFFLDVLRTPEHQCVIENSESEQKVVSFGRLLNKYKALIPSDYRLIDANCFDNVARTVISAEQSGFAPVAETKNGRFLMGVGSYDPDYPFSNSLNGLGIWPDKALASFFLAKRYSNRFTDEVSFASLLDFPGVNAEYQNIMSNMLGMAPLNKPIELVDAQGNAYTSLNGAEVNLHITEQMESLPPWPRGIADFFGISERSRERVADLILNMGLRNMQSDDYLVKERGKQQFDALTKQQDRYGLIDGNKVEFTIGGEKFVATEKNTLAYEYANKLFSDEGYLFKTFLDSYASNEFDAVVTAIDTAWGEFRTEIKPEFTNPVTMLDRQFVLAMRAHVDTELAANKEDPANEKGFADSFKAFTEAAINTGDLVYDKQAGTFSYKGGKTHTEDKSLLAYRDLYWLTPTSFESSMTSAINGVFEGYQAASVRDKQLWEADFSLLQAYAKGEYTTIAGKYYELLDQLPLASDFDK